MAITVQAVQRSINVMMALRDGPQTLTELARATGLSKGTTFRMLASLNHERLVVKDPADNLYMLGPGLLMLLEGMLTSLGSLASGAKPVLEGLRNATNETVALHMAIGAERVCVEECQSRAAIRYTSYPGAAAPLHLGSAGKVLLSFMEESQRERALVLLRPIAGEASGARIVDIDELRAQLDEVREQGWAMSYGERIADAAAISVPVRAHRFLAALSILGPKARLSRERRLELLPALQEAARTIATSLDASVRDSLPRASSTAAAAVT